MRKYKNKIVIIIVLALIMVSGIMVWQHFSSNKKNQSITDTPTDNINYDPPTKEEQQAGDTQKDQTIKDEDRRNNPPDQDSKITPVVITDAGQYDNTVEVRAFIPDHYEDGVCTITFSQDTSKIQKSTPAYKDASTTICTNPLFPRSDFPYGGDWDLSVRYEAGNTKGTSEIKTVRIN